MGAIEVIVKKAVQKALQPLVDQQKENFDKINAAYVNLQEKVKLYVAEEVKKKLNEKNK